MGKDEEYSVLFLCCSLNVVIMRSKDEANAIFAIGIAGSSIAFSQMAEEGLVTNQTCKVTASFLYAYATVAAHGIGIDEGEVDTIADFALYAIEKDIACGEIAVKETVGVKVCRIFSESLNNVVTLFWFKIHDVSH